MSRKIHTFWRSSGKTLGIISADVAKPDVFTTKRKGGRTSRWAMKKNKSYIQKDISILTKRTNENVSVDEVIPLPATPIREKETWSCANEGCLVLDPFEEDKEIINLASQSPYRETTVQKMLGSNEEREKQVLYPSEDRPIGNSMLSASGDEKETEILGPYEGIEFDGGMLCFNDIMESGLLDPNGDLTLSAERENCLMDLNFSGEIENRNLSCLDVLSGSCEEVESNTANLSTNGECDWYSSSSLTNLTSCLDDDRIDWDWENVVLGHDQQFNEKDEIISWLWEGESSKLEDKDYEKHNAMVAWLLS